ncbi:MAG TPA: sn-glycerol-1-phosphate dehydrogenase [Firmicutes bacterium]|nr:sn-glycerol-1-phosphate dehydrogenase [Bacillota bacterium]
MNGKWHDLVDQDCSCGKEHRSDVEEIVIEPGALKRLPDLVKKCGGSKVFVICDQTTLRVAGDQVLSYLKDAGIDYRCHVFGSKKPKADSRAIGEVVLNYDPSCDLILGVGTGTICDLGKVLANLVGAKYIMVATAPSMDGFASGTSSMVLHGTKTTIDSCTPTAILADIEILCRAPQELIQAGFGDIIAKYVSICEWRISHVITGEYYCEQVASLIRHAVLECVENSAGIRNRDPKGIEVLFESLVLSGIAMSLAGLSRPASGIEHYFSHIWDMRAIEFKTEADLHGIQCGVGTVLAIGIYDLIKQETPDRQRALGSVETFNVTDWNEHLRQFLGSSAEGLIKKELKEGKYDKDKHGLRLERILQNWSQIQDIINTELPEKGEVLQILDGLQLPRDPREIGIPPDVVKDTFLATKDIRDKYVASRLAWDLGILEDIAQKFY